MAGGDTARAQEHLDAIKKALSENGDGLFEDFWRDIPGRLTKLGPLDEHGVKTVCELAWWNGRQALVKGADYQKQETPKFLGRNNTI